MTTNSITLVIALHVKSCDGWAGIARLPGRPPRLSRSELLCPAVMQALLGFHSEAHWLRHVRVHYRGMFPYVPQDTGYNKRLRATLPQVKRLIRVLARTPTSGTTPGGSATPRQCPAGCHGPR